MGERDGGWLSFLLCWRYWSCYRNPSSPAPHCLLRGNHHDGGPRHHPAPCRRCARSGPMEHARHSYQTLPNIPQRRTPITPTHALMLSPQLVRETGAGVVSSFPLRNSNRVSSPLFTFLLTPQHAWPGRRIWSKPALLVLPSDYRREGFHALPVIMRQVRRGG